MSDELSPTGHQALLAPSFREVTAIRIHMPVAQSTLVALSAGRLRAIEDDLGLARMLLVIQSHPILGDFGLYRSVVELVPGWEFFTPTASARPTLGVAEQPQASPNVILTVHAAIDAPSDDVERALTDLIAAHPWETPVIEIATMRLLVRR